MSGRADTGIVIATMLEAEPLVRALGLELSEKKPFRIFEGGSVRLVVSGIGKTNAAMASAYLCMSHGSAVLVNAGAAGALKEGMAVGDIFHIRRVLEADRPNILGKGDRWLDPEMLGGGPPAVLATQDRPAILAAERSALACRAELADMEGAGFVQACRLFGAKGFLFKIVSDLPGDETDRDIVSNITLVSGKLAGYIAGTVLPALA
jgi:adenosylhomocysteine nucleosidase